MQVQAMARNLNGTQLTGAACGCGMQVASIFG